MSRDQHFSGKEIDICYSYFSLFFVGDWGVGGGVTLFLSLTCFKIFEVYFSLTFKF